jgi:hypothetical protein
MEIELRAESKTKWQIEAKNDNGLTARIDCKTAKNKQEAEEYFLDFYEHCWLYRVVEIEKIVEIKTIKKFGEWKEEI